MEATILRSECYRVIDKGEPVDLVFVTLDRRRGTGGKLVQLKQWRKIIGEEDIEILPGQVRRKARSLQKDPDHKKNKTFVMHNPLHRAQHPITVHWRLIQYLNGKRVING